MFDPPQQQKRQIKTLYRKGVSSLHFEDFGIVSTLCLYPNNSRTIQLISYESVLPSIFSCFNLGNVKILQNKEQMYLKVENAIWKFFEEFQIWTSNFDNCEALA